MGVLNVTPDSFSDGGRYADLDAAVAHGVRHARATAPTSSTWAASRPARAPSGSTPTTESARVLPVIRELAAAGVPMSIDTTRAEVAAAALAAGAPRGQRRVRRARRPGHGQRGRRRRVPVGAHALARPLPADAGAGRVRATWSTEVRDELRQRVDAAVAARGRRRTGSSSTPAWASRSGPSTTGASRPTSTRSSSLGFPVLVGASRKSYLGAPARRRPTARRGRSDEREAATVATSLLAVQAGAWGVRVHDVLGTVDALKVLLAAERREAGRDDADGRCDRSR